MHHLKRYYITVIWIRSSRFFAFLCMVFVHGFCLWFAGVREFWGSAIRNSAISVVCVICVHENGPGRSIWHWSKIVRVDMNHNVCGNGPWLDADEIRYHILHVHVQVVMAIKCRGEQLLGGLYTGINTKHITVASRMVRLITNPCMVNFSEPFALTKCKFLDVLSPFWYGCAGGWSHWNGCSTAQSYCRSQCVCTWERHPSGQEMKVTESHAEYYLLTMCTTFGTRSYISFSSQVMENRHNVSLLHIDAGWHA